MGRLYIIWCGIKKKRRRSLYLLLVPHFEAFALPIIVKRATQKPTPIGIYIHLRAPSHRMESVHQGL